MATGHDGQTAGVQEPAIATARISLARCATRERFSVGDRSKREAERVELARKFEEAKNAPARRLIRCRSCKKSQRQVPIMIEMGGFVFCSDCIEFAAKVIAEQKAGR
jgi:hypothetical protein